MRIVFAGSQQRDLNLALAQWLEARLQAPRPFRQPFSTIGVFDEDELVAVLLFENYRPEDGTVEVGGAATTRRWMTRAVANALAKFIFGDLDCQMAIFRTSERNKSLSMLMKRAGFELIVIPRLRGRDEAEHWFFMTSEAWAENPLNRQEKLAPTNGLC